MTFNLAWTYKGRVYLLCDSAVTHHGMTGVSRSSLGEVVETNVAEAALKLFELGDGAVAIGSGDGGALDRLAERVSDHTTAWSEGLLRQRIRDAAAGIHFFQTSTLLIAFREMGRARLFAYSSGGTLEEVEDGTVVCTRAWREEISLALRYLPVVIERKDRERVDAGRLPFDETSILCYLLAYATTLCLHFPSMESEGVGGLFVGAAVSGRDTFMTPAIMYVLHQPDVSLTSFSDVAVVPDGLPEWANGVVFSYLRDGCLQAYSSITAETKVIWNSTTRRRDLGPPRQEDIVVQHPATWRDEVQAYIFVNRRGLQANVVRVVRGMSAPVNLLVDNHNYYLAVEPWLADKISAPESGGIVGGYPVVGVGMVLEQSLSRKPPDCL
ncbi:MAG: hypothetical protein Q8P18_07555 [Pseudomonadota bacterium]|nr:hypothetical protein [Pseudomonadota bacterium]